MAEIRQRSKAVMAAEDTLYSDEEAGEVEDDPEANEDDPPRSSSVAG